MHTTRLRHRLIAVATAATLSLSTAAVSVAAPIGPGSGSGSGSDAAGCKLPGNGKTIDSGTQGTDSNGTVYSCSNGTGCQVEGGKITDKCSHMNAVHSTPPRKVTGPVMTAPVAKASHRSGLWSRGTSDVPRGAPHPPQV